MVDRSQFLARLASTTQLVFAVIIGAVASMAFEPSVVPRGVVLFVIFSLPGVVGWIGSAARRPVLLIAAGITSAIGAFIAFSGVTLIFLVPAVLFLFGAVQLQAGPGTRPAEPWTHGVIRLGMAVAIVVLVVAAGASAILVTDSGCWSEIRTPAGMRIEMTPYTTGEMGIPDGATSASCSTGIISARGVGLGGLLGVAAVGLAFATARRSGRPS